MTDHDTPASEVNSVVGAMSGTGWHTPASEPEICPRCDSDDPSQRLQAYLEGDDGPIPLGLCDNDAFHDTPASEPTPSEEPRFSDVDMDRAVRVTRAESDARVAEAFQRGYLAGSRGDPA